MAQLGTVLSSNTFLQWLSHANRAYQRLDAFASDDQALTANTINANVALNVTGTTSLTGANTNIQGGSLLVTSNANFTEGVQLQHGSLVIYTDTGSPSYIDMYCGTSNIHRVKLQAPQHANAIGAFTRVLTLPAANGTLLWGSSNTTHQSVTTNFTIEGDLTVNGSTTELSANDITVNDPLIKLAANNEFSDTIDIGFVGHYYDGSSSQHAGLFRDASDSGTFKLFKTYAIEPNTALTIDTTDGSFALGDLDVNTLDAQVITLAGANLATRLNSDLANTNVYIATKLDTAGGTMTGVIAGFESTGIDDNATSTALTIDSSGNVGIGTSPAEDLHVEGDTNGATIRFDRASNNQAYLGIDNGEALYLSIGDKTYQQYAIEWNGGSDYHAWSTGGASQTERMRIDSSGNVGIGTSAPASKAHIVGSSNDTVSQTNANLNIEGAGGNGIVVGTISSGPYTSYLQSGFVDNFGTATYPIALNPSGGNIGIGTANPQATLDVNGNFDLSGAGTADRHIEIGVGRTGDGNSYIDLISDTTYTDYGARLIRYNSGANAYTRLDHRGTGALSLWATDAGALQFGTSNADRMRIDSSGNVGIGTTSPNELLTVQRNGTAVAGLSPSTVASFQSTSATTQSSYVSIIAGSTGSTGQAALFFGDADDPDIGQVLYRNSDDSMDFVVNASSRMKILSSGNVGIGTTPSYKLDVDGDVNANRYLSSTYTATTSGSVTLDFASYQNFVITLNGNITLANPSTEAAGQSGVIIFIQDGTGSRTCSLGTDYETAAASGITLSTTAGQKDIIPYYVQAGGSILLGRPTRNYS
jgi:hypothetical protein